MIVNIFGCLVILNASVLVMYFTLSNPFIGGIVVLAPAAIIIFFPLIIFLPTFNVLSAINFPIHLNKVICLLDLMLFSISPASVSTILEDLLVILAKSIPFMLALIPKSSALFNNSATSAL